MTSSCPAQPRSFSHMVRLPNMNDSATEVSVVGGSPPGRGAFSGDAKKRDMAKLRASGS